MRRLFWNRIELVALVICAAAFMPRLAGAQDLTNVAAAMQSPVDSSTLQRAQPRAPQLTLNSAETTSRISPIMQSLYVSTAVVQGLDALSTFKALHAGAVESNSIVQPFASNRPAFVAVKAAMATAFIYEGHQLSKGHKIRAIVVLGLINSVYTGISLHNYHVANVMTARR